MIEEGRKLQPWFVQAGIQEDVEQSQKWKERGGEIVSFSPDEGKKMHDLLATVGADVTKSDPNVKSFYEKVLAVSKKY